MLYRAQVTIPMDSGLSEDACVNTWHFEGPGVVLASDADEIQPLLERFYGIEVVGRSAISGYWSALVDHLSVRLRVYAMSDPEPRLPVLDTIMDVDEVPAAGSLPHEVALCMSYQGAIISGGNKARRRGRVFLGPFNTSANSNGRPVDDLPLSVNASAARLLDEATASPVDWVVSSGTGEGTTLVTNGWCDNAWDTQRRRGHAVTLRRPWP